MRERKEPTLSKSLIGQSICESTVGAVQVLFLSARGIRVITAWAATVMGPWAEPLPNQPDVGPVRHVSCGDCFSCALEKQRVWLWPS